MNSHHTTTFDRIVRLYDEARRLLDKRDDDFLTADDQRRFREIREHLDQFWEKERAERVFAADGPPRMISDQRPMPHGRPRQTAYGMAPLPSGGD